MAAIKGREENDPRKIEKERKEEERRTFRLRKHEQDEHEIERIQRHEKHIIPIPTAYPSALSSPNS